MGTRVEYMGAVLEYKLARLRWSQTDRTCIDRLKGVRGAPPPSPMFKWAVAVRSSSCVTQPARCSGVCETAVAQGAVRVGSNASERSTLSVYVESSDEPEEFRGLGVKEGEPSRDDVTAKGEVSK